MADDPILKSAIDQAAAVRAGEVSARELVEASLAAIERSNGELNAFVTLSADRALAEADAIAPGDARALAGVPIGIKDLTVTEGIPTSFGTRASGDWVPPFDAGLVARLRAAGAVIVGKTNTPEFGARPVTEPERFGPTRNPWDRSRTAGGSSGGSGAAVAAGMVALAHGNDGGGSIRIPASCCGVVGLKPSRGRISAAPLADSPFGFSAEGALTRTVADTALALDVMAGYEWGDPASPPPPRTTFADSIRIDPGRLRIGWAVSPPNGVDVHEDCVAAVAAVAELLESLGHAVEESSPRWEGEPFEDAFVTAYSAETAVYIDRLGAAVGGEVDRALLEPLSRELLEHARSAAALEPVEAMFDLRRYARRTVRWWADHDVLLTPTLAQPPVSHGALDAPLGAPALEAFRRGIRFVPFTAPFNVTGQPAISLPLHHPEGGLPIGVQLVGPPAGEEMLLSLAAQLERAAPWADRRPALATA